MPRLSIYISLICFFASCSQMEKSNKEMEHSQEDQIISPFLTELADTSLESQQLSEEQLLAFDKRAVQKVEDLMDYLNIIADQKYAKELRKNTLKIAFTLFQSDSSTMKNIRLLGNREYISIHEYLKKLYKGKAAFAQFNLVDVKQNSPFTMLSENNYISSISVTENSLIFTIDLILKKNEKTIGENKFDVWEIKLADVY